MSHTLEYSRLLQDLKTRIARSHVSMFSPSSAPLRSFLETQFTGDQGLVSTPVFQHKFGFLPCKETMADLVEEGLLTNTLVTNMANPPEEYQEQRFEGHFHPYTHQLQSWRALKRSETTSVVVSAGTGAGKTECFVVPILDDLARQTAAQRAPLEGVQALFLYPLNALINSQKERLSAWMRGFNGDLRFCLYKGDTPNAKLPVGEARRTPEQVCSRAALRESPPPMLITNATMLEYMLVRPIDAPIIKKSKGKLRYIVIDEAHTYVGSMAAELTLLLRRVMNAFEVQPSDVRFIATSATLSSGGDAQKAQVKIKQFLADVSGQPVSSVEVFTDDRIIAELPKVPSVGVWPDLQNLQQQSAQERFQSLCSHAGPRRLREQLIERPYMASELASSLTEQGLEIEESNLIGLLDCCTTARLREGADSFLPLRGHLFARPAVGKKACLNPACSGREGTPLDDERWPFGAVISTEKERCQWCDGLVFELDTCEQCGLELLVANEVKKGLYTVLQKRDNKPNRGEGRQGGELSLEGEELVELPEHAPQRTRNLVLVSRPFPNRSPSDFLMPSVTIGYKDGSIEGEEGALFSLTYAHNHRIQCPHCSRRRGSGAKVFYRSLRSSRDFLLHASIPTFLAAMRPEEGAISGKLPFEGRRTITFTDSRQGTARFAAKMQDYAQRDAIRHFIYHDVLAARSGALKDKAAELDGEIAEYENELKGRTDAFLERKLEKLRRQRADLTEKPQPLNEVASRLARTATFKHLIRHWRRYKVFEYADVSETRLAQWLVQKEFLRRPVRGRSLETLGLASVHFASYNGPVPEIWRGWAKEDAANSWRDFLKLMVDFVLRANTVVGIDDEREFLRWVGTDARPSLIAAPGKPANSQSWPRVLGWPTIAPGRAVHRMARLIGAAFSLDYKDPRVVKQINQVLDDAFSGLKDCLRGTEEGFNLSFSNASVSLIEEAWICPITSRVLDTTLLGHTPYQPYNYHPERCVPVRMPVPPDAFWLKSLNPKQWLSTDPVVKAARVSGALSEFAERILGKPGYFQTAEHSAQVSTSDLKRVEKSFKEGWLNLLSCSTTMEMGVDIGNLTGVAMNNAPPNPANFLQRVGRAGRRNEDAAVSLTICRPLPHDQEVFRRPDWAFRTPMHITGVMWESKPIVDRHLRSALLTAYFQTERAADERIHRLNCHWFFGSETVSVCTTFVQWLNTITEETHSKLAIQLKRITLRTVRQGQPLCKLLDRAAGRFSEAQRRFDEEHNALVALSEELVGGGAERSPAAASVNKQIARVEGEYLLSFLADHQILPGYGFPSGIVSFTTTTLEELKVMQKEEERAKRRIGNNKEALAQERRLRRAQLDGPSRDLPKALSEYAPGAEVVLNARTYTSAGVTLNWHIPAQADRSTFDEVQNILYLWQCRRCGRGSESRQKVTQCDGCGAALDTVDKVLVPSGFAVDLFRPVEMRVPSSPSKVPPAKVQISSGSEPFTVVGEKKLLRFRHASNGVVHYRQKSENRLGYCICLYCGRAAAERFPTQNGVNGDLPRAMRNHLRLRGGKGNNWRDPGASARCEGNNKPFALQRYMSLGGWSRTDVLELQIRDQNGKLVEDKAHMTTLAVAFRRAAARFLGVDEREMRYQVENRFEGQVMYCTLLLMDTASGGAGLCAELSKHVPELLRMAKSACECAEDCDKACHACLLTSDTQHEMDFLDRRLIWPKPGERAKILTQSFFDSIDLQDEHRLYGAHTKVLFEPLQIAVENVARRHADTVQEVVLFVGGEPNDWDILDWSGRRLLRSLREANIPVTVAIPHQAVNEVDWQQRRQLNALVYAEGAVLKSYEPQGSMTTMVQVLTAEHRVGFAVTHEACFSSQWGKRSPGETWVSGTGGPEVVLTEVSFEEKQEPVNLVEVDLRFTSAGLCRGFGQRFWSVLFQSCSWLREELESRGPVQSVEVLDRYIRSPTATLAWYLVLEFLATKMNMVERSTTLVVRTSAAANGRQPNLLYHNWRSSSDQQAVMEGLFGGVCKTKVVVERSVNKLAHYRALRLSWGDFGVEVRLDHGLGYVRTAPKMPPFPFSKPVNEQVSALMNRRDVWLAPNTGNERVLAYVLRSKKNQ